MTLNGVIALILRYLIVFQLWPKLFHAAVAIRFICDSDSRKLFLRFPSTTLLSLANNQNWWHWCMITAFWLGLRPADIRQRIATRLQTWRWAWATRDVLASVRFCKTSIQSLYALNSYKVPKQRLSKLRIQIRITKHTDEETTYLLRSLVALQSTCDPRSTWTVLHGSSAWIRRDTCTWRRGVDARRRHRTPAWIPLDWRSAVWRPNTCSRRAVGVTRGSDAETRHWCYLELLHHRSLHTRDTARYDGPVWSIKYVIIRFALKWYGSTKLTMKHGSVLLASRVKQFYDQIAQSYSITFYSRNQHSERSPFFLHSRQLWSLTDF